MPSVAAYGLNGRCRGETAANRRISPGTPGGFLEGSQEHRVLVVLAGKVVTGVSAGMAK